MFDEEVSPWDGLELGSKGLTNKFRTSSKEVPRYDLEGLYEVTCKNFKPLLSKCNLFSLKVQNLFSSPCLVCEGQPRDLNILLDGRETVVQNCVKYEY